MPGHRRWHPWHDHPAGHDQFDQPVRTWGRCKRARRMRLGRSRLFGHLLRWRRLCLHLRKPWRRIACRVFQRVHEAEKLFLRPFTINLQNTLYTNISDGVARELEAKSLIYRASSVSNFNQTFPFNLEPVARRILTPRPKLLD